MKGKRATQNWKSFFGESILEMTEVELNSLERFFPFFNIRAKRIKPKSIHFDDNEDYWLGNLNHSEELEEIINAPPIQVCCEKNCLDQISAREIHLRRSQFATMEKEQKDISLLMLLAVGMKSELTSTLHRQRIRFIYRFDQTRTLCRKAFQYIYCIGDSHLRRLKKLAEAGRLLPPAHGNTNKPPANSISKEDSDRVLQFIENFADIHGLPNPGRIRNNSREILLAADQSLLSIWTEYKEAISDLRDEKSEHRVVGYGTFRNIWKQGLAHIKIQSSRSDLCDLCQDIQEKIRYSNSSDDMNSLIQIYNRHYEKVRVARELYTKELEASKACWESMPDKLRRGILNNLSTHGVMREQSACSVEMTMHYSFDYSQQVHYPFSNQQRGKEYFIVPRRCQIFGVCAEALSRQVLFLTDESESIGKGSQAIISMLDAFFRFHGVGETVVRLHADNCVGQNKNKYVMWYLLWRVMNGLHKEITISFMVPGHTKFSPDAYFGLFKIRYRNLTIDCLQDLVYCVQSSLHSGGLVPQVYGTHLRNSEPFYEYRDWNNYLEQYLKPIPRISEYNYFSFSEEYPGWIYLRVNPEDTPDKLFLLKDRYFKFPLPIKYPSIIIPEGLSKERQQYLFKNVRQFVRNPRKKDYTCPKPT